MLDVVLILSSLALTWTDSGWLILIADCSYVEFDSYSR